MKDVLNLLYFVFSFIAIVGFAGSIYRAVELLRKVKNDEEPRKIIYGIINFTEDATAVRIGLNGLIATALYQLIFL